MSLYQCSCGEKTEVIDTRTAYKRLRRRRKCKAGHRFSTVEVPLESTTNLKDLVLFWARETGQEDLEMLTAMNNCVDRIMLGIPIPDG